jgi:DNA-binding SARP family transcriptional activator
VEQLPSTSAVCCDTSGAARCTWQLSSHRQTLRLEIRRRSRLTAVLTPERWAETAAAPRAPLQRLILPRGELPLGGRLRGEAIAAPGSGRSAKATTGGESAGADTPAGEGASAAGGEGGSDDPADVGVGIGLLGPVEIVGSKASLARRHRLTELIAYLAFHSEGVTGERLAAALWPEHRVTSQTVANRLHEARQALGPAPDGRGRIRLVHGRHKLSGDVATDWGRFLELTGPRSGPSSWRRALSLVRGRPFTGLSQGDWVGLEGVAARVETEIGDVAERLGEHLLASGDPEGAAWAARRGIAGAPWDERLYRLLMRAADATGSRGAVDSALCWLAAALEWEGDPLEVVHPATAALYRKLAGWPDEPDRAPAGHRRRAAGAAGEPSTGGPTRRGPAR